MTKLIKKPVPAIPTFTVGQRVRFNTDGGDGRTYYTNHHEGTVTKVNRVNLIVEKDNGYVYQVAKTAVY
jgi:hypothetical protein